MITSNVFPGIRNKMVGLLERCTCLYIASALIVGIFMLGLFGEIAWNTLIQQSMEEFDETIIWLVRSAASPSLDVFMLNITNVGSAAFYGLFASIVLLGLLSFERKREAITLVLCVAGGALLNEVLKQVFQRSRPETLPLLEIGGYSFPSGHAMVSLCCYGMLAFLLARNLTSWRTRVIVFMITVIFVTIVGISRIYVGVHYPTDVLAGFAVGMTWLAFCIAFLLWWEYRDDKFRNINLP